MTTPSLDQLRDIHLPPPPGLWPPAPAWWLAGLALALGSALWIVRRQIRRRPLHTALRELAMLADTHSRDRNDVLLARGVSRLLRRYALWRFPDAGAAGLSGTDWLGFLDQHGGAGRFTQGPGKLLESLPYRHPENISGTTEATALVALTRDWLQANAP